MDKRISYLQLIQGVITRMASNSFKLKGWAVTLVAGIFVLAEKEADRVFFLVAYIPVIAFWFLDSYYLLQERLYRALYDKARRIKEEEIDYSLKADADEFGRDKNTLVSCLFSRTELVFYAPLAIVCAGIIIVSIFVWD